MLSPFGPLCKILTGSRRAQKCVVVRADTNPHFHPSGGFSSCIRQLNLSFLTCDWHSNNHPGTVSNRTRSRQHGADARVAPNQNVCGRALRRGVAGLRPANGPTEAPNVLRSSALNDQRWVRPPGLAASFPTTASSQTHLYRGAVPCATRGPFCIPGAVSGC